MSFLNRYAKIQSKIDSNGNDLTVSVFDDEIGDGKPIMWLEGTFSTFSELGLDEETSSYIIEHEGYEADDRALIVDIINFDDKLYYSLPEKRQNMMSVVLLKNFLKYYNENYGKDSGYWMPVSADFANYDLQEKFKQEVEKGTFPDVSKYLIGETSQSEWQNSYYNKNNRDDFNNITKELVGYLQEQGIVVNNETTVVNYSVLECINMCKNYLEESGNEDKASEFLSYVGIVINGSDAEYNLPFKNINIPDSPVFLLTSNGNNFVRYNENIDVNLLLSAEPNLRIALDGCQIIPMKQAVEHYSLDEFFDVIKEQAGLLTTANYKRLIKKNSSK